MNEKSYYIYGSGLWLLWGGIINRDYHNSKSVKWLKNAVSDWRWTKEYGNTCPDCLAKMK